jgi:hypothetical protein
VTQHAPASALLPRICTTFETALERGTLATLLDDFQPAKLPVHLVYTASRFLPIKLTPS